MNTLKTMILCCGLMLMVFFGKFIYAQEQDVATLQPMTHAEVVQATDRLGKETQAVHDGLNDLGQQIANLERILRQITQLSQPSVSPPTPAATTPALIEGPPIPIEEGDQKNGAIPFDTAGIENGHFDDQGDAEKKTQQTDIFDQQGAQGQEEANPSTADMANKIAQVDVKTDVALIKLAELENIIADIDADLDVVVQDMMAAQPFPSLSEPVAAVNNDTNHASEDKRLRDTQGVLDTVSQQVGTPTVSPEPSTGALDISQKSASAVQVEHGGKKPPLKKTRATTTGATIHRTHTDSMIAVTQIRTGLATANITGQMTILPVQLASRVTTHAPVGTVETQHESIVNVRAEENPPVWWAPICIVIGLVFAVYLVIVVLHYTEKRKRRWGPL